MKITVLKPSKGKVTTTWLTPAEVVDLLRSDRYSKEIGEYREVYPMMKEEKMELPRVNSQLPALCFGAELERTGGNDYTGPNTFHPVIAQENRLLLIEVSNMKDYREATRLRNIAAELPLTYMAFIGYDDRSLKVIVRFEASGYDHTADATRDAFRNVRQFYSAQLGVTPDITDPSPLQLCTLSFDPEAYYNENATPFYLTSRNPYSPKTQTLGDNHQETDPQTSHNSQLLPGRNQEQTERMVFQFCLEKALDKHFFAEDGEDAERILSSLAVYCRESDIPLANAIRKTSYRPDLCTDMDLVKRIFTSTYKRLAKRKGDPMRHVNQNSLLMWQTRYFMDTYYDLRMNVLTRRPEFRRKDVPGAPFRTLEKEDQNSMTIHALTAGLKSWDRDLARYINSREIAQYNPIEDYLLNLPKWDGTDRIAPLARRVPVKDAHWTEYFSIWMRSMVSQWMGCSRRYGSCMVLMLTGAQGTGKSTFMRMLLPPELSTYYLDRLDFTTKKDAERALTRFALINIDEYDQISRSQTAFLKHLLQKSNITQRKMYEDAYTQSKRYAVFAATTNSPQPLADVTGSRRYLVEEVEGQIDVSTIGTHAIDYPQLYAQLLTEVRHGEPAEFDALRVHDIQQHNLRFTVNDPLNDIFQSMYTQPDDQGSKRLQLSPMEILQGLHKECQGIPANRSNAIRLGKLLVSNHFRQITIHGRSVYEVERR